MSDYIFIKNLVLKGIHGVYESEQKNPQTFKISAKIFLDSAPKEDFLEETIDYTVLVKDIETAFFKKSYALLEILSEEIAFQLLLNHLLIKQIDLSIHKTEMGLNYNYDSIGIFVSRKRNISFIALGSNLGDRKAHLQKSIQILKNDPYIELIKVSDFIETKPFKVDLSQGMYLNGVAKIITFYPAEKLLNKLQKIEISLGGVKEKNGGPRIIDIDILTYNDLVLNKTELTLPHPRIKERTFVLDPWASIDPDFFHPALGKTIGDLKKDLENTHLENTNDNE